MKTILIGLGAMLIVGGWGATRYANDVISMRPIGNSRTLAWQGERYTTPYKEGGTFVDVAGPSPRDLAIGGYVTMALGAGVLGTGYVAGQRSRRNLNVSSSSETA